MPAPWTELPTLAIDTETSGVDVFNDRIVEAAAVEVFPDGETGTEVSTIVNPGIAIPDEAAAIHGIDTERARAEGMAPAKALRLVAERAWRHVSVYDGQAAIVIFNTRFDLPLLVNECARHRVEWPPFAGILDPLVMDRIADFWRLDEAVHFQPVAHTHDGGYEQARAHRRSRRQLTKVAPLYGVELSDDDAHGALPDATAAGRVLWGVARRFPAFTRHSLASLWLWQVQGAEAERDRLQDWTRQNRDPSADLVSGWPLPTRAEQRAVKPKPAPATDPVPMDDVQNRRVHALLAKARPGEDRHAVLTELLGRPVSSAKELSVEDAHLVIEALDAETRTNTAGATA
jgi:DNA polymerase III subunit epsilon